MLQNDFDPEGDAITTSIAGVSTSSADASPLECFGDDGGELAQGRVCPVIFGGVIADRSPGRRIPKVRAISAAQPLP